MLVRPLQTENAEEPIDVTLLGIVTLVSPVQSWNAQSPIDVTLSGIVTLVSPVQYENAQSPIDVTLSGIVTLVRFVQSENAPSPIDVTEIPLILRGITMSDCVFPYEDSPVTSPLDETSTQGIQSHHLAINVTSEAIDHFPFSTARSP